MLPYCTIYGYNMCMDTILQKLLAIESDAQQAMNTLAKDEAQLKHRMEAELLNRISEMETEGNKKIAELKHLSNEETALKISEIKAEYKIKLQKFLQNFNENRQKWRGEIFNEIISGR